MTILFYPDLPKEHNRIYRLCKDLGIDFHNNLNKQRDVGFFWSYVQDKYTPDKFAIKSELVNKGCFDVTKSRVAKCFKEELINPETFKGEAVKKSEKQARHDGVIVNCPVRREPGYVYQKLITTGKDAFVDYRVFWSGQIDFVIVKVKKDQFKTSLTEAFMAEPQDVFTPDEIARIETGCKSFGLDFGEVDALRDINTGQLMIIDVNNMPGRGIFTKYPKFWDRYRDTFKQFIYGCRTYTLL